MPVYDPGAEAHTKRVRIKDREVADAIVAAGGWAEHRRVKLACETPKGIDITYHNAYVRARLLARRWHVRALIQKEEVPSHASATKLPLSSTMLRPSRR